MGCHFKMEPIDFFSMERLLKRVHYSFAHTFSRSIRDIAVLFKPCPFVMKFNIDLDRRVSTVFVSIGIA
jgi:hypothetical protein